MSVSILTKFSERKRYFTPAGSIYETTYQEEIEKKSGKKHLVPVGKTNVYEMIQQDLEQSKIDNIIHKLAMGDYSVLKQAELTYVDANDYPKSLMEAQNIVIKAKEEFNKFPEEVRKAFNNSAEQYVSEMGTEKWIDKMAPFNQDIKDKYRPEPIEPIPPMPKTEEGAE